MRRLNITFLICSLLVFSCGKDPKSVNQAELKYQMAQGLLEKGETTQGMAELMAAKELDPDNAEVRNLLGLAYIQNNHPELAEPEFRKAVELDPKFSEARNHLCAFLVQKKKYDEAIEQCTKAVENVTYATPERAYHNMGLAYQAKGDNAKALDSYKKALIHNPNFVMSRKALGMLFIQQKKTKEGILQLEGASTVCGQSPKGAWGDVCPETFYQLAILYAKGKERSKAVSMLKKCVEADDQGTYGQKCRDNLKILE